MAAMKDMTPAALAHAIVERLWPPGIKRDSTRAEVEWAIADAIAKARRADARLCRMQVKTHEGIWSAPHQVAANFCATAILAQNRRPR